MKNTVVLRESSVEGASKQENRLIWLDLEMTGLDPEKDTILEIATIVTDSELNLLAEGPVYAIHHEEAALQAMDTWCAKTHRENGLVMRVRASITSTLEAELGTLNFLEQWVEVGASPLCGNSIGHDKRFLAKYMPAIHAYCHYRSVDVSTIKELAMRWYPRQLVPFPKKNHHLALADIRESIEELRYYRTHIFRAVQL